MDTMRWKYGDTNPVFPAVDSATEIEIGDLLWQDVDDAKPASCQPAKDRVTLSQNAFADNFLGVAMQRSRSGDTNPIRVATTGVFEFDCPSGTFELGVLMGADEALHGSLFNQRVASATRIGTGIGYVAKRVPTHATSVLVDIRSRVMGHSI